MNIEVIQEGGSRKIPSHLTGGEYAINDLVIRVDKKLSRRTKQELIIHSIIENYCSPWEHSKVDELTGLIVETLDKLKARG